MTSTLLALACLALLSSRSVAGLLTALAVVVTMPLWPIFRLRPTLVVAAAVFGAVAIGGITTWLSTASEVMVAAVGKDPSLTGRAELWVQLFACPPNAKPPTPMTDGAVSPCPECKKKRTPRRHPVRHGKKKAGTDDDEEG